MYAVHIKYLLHTMPFRFVYRTADISALSKLRDCLVHKYEWHSIVHITLTKHILHLFFTHFIVCLIFLAFYTHYQHFTHCTLCMYIVNAVYIFRIVQKPLFNCPVHLQSWCGWLSICLSICLFVHLQSRYG